MFRRAFVSRFVLFCLLLLLCFYTFSTQAQNQIIKVKLGKKSHSLSLSSSQPLILENIKNLRLNSKALFFKVYNDKTIAINNKFKIQGSIVIKSNGLIRFGKKQYKGKIILHPTKKGIEIINHVDLENYVHGVVLAEMPNHWNLEALKSQAVISRTYALYKKALRNKKQWHLLNSTLDQVYHGYRKNKHVAQAVQSTKRIIVTQNQKVVPTYFHANAGGTTEIAENVWNKKLDHIKAVTVPYGQSDPNFYWTYRIHKDRFIKHLKESDIKLPSSFQIKIVARTASGRIKKIRLSGNQYQKELSAQQFRRLIGENKLKSTKFHFQLKQDYLYFYGQGYGHGIGLCQWCAQEMADKGFRFDQIIKGFYKNIDLSLLAL